MQIKSLFTKLLAGAAAIAMLAVPAFAGEAPKVFTTPDNVLSIEAPGSQWDIVKGSGYWFEISDGQSDIAISHLSNGEALPAQSVADSNNAAQMQSLISTKNEVFVVNAVSSSQQSLQDLIKAVGSIRILAYDTKTAVKAESTKAAAPEKKENTASSSQAGKKITVYAASGATTEITLGEDGVWKDSKGNSFYNTVDTMYYDEVNDLFWNSDPEYWKKREAEGITTWVTVYAENGNTDEIGLGLDNVWRNRENEEYIFDTVNTYIGPDGGVWAIYPDYWEGHKDEASQTDNHAEASSDSNEEASSDSNEETSDEETGYEEEGGYIEDDDVEYEDAAAYEYDEYEEDYAEDAE